jgi:hypothetical protein
MSRSEHGVDGRSHLCRKFLRRILVEKKLSEMAAQWKKAALEDLAKCKPASRSEFANQMLLATAEVLEWKLRVFSTATTE